MAWADNRAREKVLPSSQLTKIMAFYWKDGYFFTSLLFGPSQPEAFQILQEKHKNFSFRAENLALASKQPPHILHKSVFIVLCGPIIHCINPYDQLVICIKRETTQRYL
jgi:hypothetical protein